MKMLCTTITVLILCSAMSMYGSDNILIIAHRGASGDLPENTLQSFQGAMDCGALMIELDVHLCATGHLVVIHDQTVDRTTDGQGEVAQMTLAELKCLDAGNGQTIPTLDEVFELVDRRMRINVELKGVGTGAPVADLIEHYVNDRGWLHTDFRISSLDFEQLQDFRICNKRVDMGLTLVDIPESCNKLLADINHLQVSGVDAWIEGTTCVFIQLMHEQGLTVYLYTINGPKQFETVSNCGADGIYTNYPEKFL